MKNCLQIIAILAIPLLVTNCKGKDETPTEPTQETVKPKGNRSFGIHITEAELGQYDAHFDTAASTGMDLLPFLILWNTIDTGGGFNFTIPDIANVYYPAKGIGFFLNVSPIEAIRKSFPKDIDTLPFDHPIVIQRFKTTLDSLKSRMPGVQVPNLMIGNEIDLYLSNTAQWNAYTIFFDSCRLHAKSLWGSQLKVGTEVTYSALNGGFFSNIQTLNTHTDFIGVSYYPLQADFTVKSVSQARNDLQSIFQKFPGRKIALEETGYQSAVLCNSSEAQQREFIAMFFGLWDEYADRLDFVGFLWLTDLSDVQTNQYVVDYGMSGQPTEAIFKAYLQTLGLRSYNGYGSHKPAFHELRKQARMRGW